MYPDSPQEGAAAAGPQPTPVAILNNAYLELLQWEETKSYPEVGNNFLATILTYFKWHQLITTSTEWITRSNLGIIHWQVPELKHIYYRDTTVIPSYLRYLNLHTVGRVNGYEHEMLDERNRRLSPFINIYCPIHWPMFDHVGNTALKSEVKYMRIM